MALVDTPSEPVAPLAPVPNRWRWATLAVALVAVITIGVTVMAENRGSGSTTLSARDVATTQQARDACQQWATTQAAGPTSARGWCGQFSDWMYDQMASGRRLGSTMWGSPQAMRDTCVQAMAGYPAAAADPATWCDGMVDWMAQHGGGWAGWMSSPMMGR